VLNKLGTPKTCTFSGLVVVSVVTDVVSFVVVTVVPVVVVAVVDVVLQSPSAYSSSFVLAPAMQVPAGPPLFTASLHPQAPVQSIPHLIKLHGSTSTFVVVDVVLASLVVAAVSLGNPDDPDDPDPNAHTSSTSEQQSPST
jgi:hypothetical protein